MSNLILFLGGTVGKSNWRNQLIPLLQKENLSYFNPVVEDWNEEAQEKENQVKKSPNTIELYVITKEIKGVYSIAEAVDASNKKPTKTIFLILREGFDEHSLKSLDATSRLIKENGANVVSNLNEIVMLFKGMNLTYKTKKIVRLFTKR